MQIFRPTLCSEDWNKKPNYTHGTCSSRLKEQAHAITCRQASYDRRRIMVLELCVCVCASPFHPSNSKPKSASEQTERRERSFPRGSASEQTERRERSFPRGRSPKNGEISSSSPFYTRRLNCTRRCTRLPNSSPLGAPAWELGIF